jgi:hypothetical protein
MPSANAGGPPNPGPPPPRPSSPAAAAGAALAATLPSDADFEAYFGEV